MELFRTRATNKVKVGSTSSENEPGPTAYQLEEEIKILQNLISMLSYGMRTSKRAPGEDETRKDAKSVIKEIQRVISKLQYIEKFPPKCLPPPCAPRQDFNGETVILKVESEAKDRVIESLQQELEEVKKIKCQKEEEVNNWAKRYDLLVEHSVERGFLVQESEEDGSQCYRLAEREELEEFYSISFKQPEREDKSVGCEDIDLLQEVVPLPAVSATNSLSTAIGLAIRKSVPQESAISTANKNLNPADSFIDTNPVATEKSIPEGRQLRPRVPKVIPRVPPTISSSGKSVTKTKANLRSTSSAPKKPATTEPASNSSFPSGSGGEDIPLIRPNPRGRQPLPKGVKVRQYNYIRIPGSERVQCKECKKTFSEAIAFRYHYRKEHVGIRYECKKCKARFTAPNGLQYHEKKCGEPDFKQPCYICKFRFVGLAALKVHMKKEHGKK